MTTLFDSFSLRDIEFKNRIIIPPMVMYRSGHDGKANDWHLTHYGRFAIGGASLVFVESTQVEAQGRIGYADLGLWNDDQIAPLRRIADFMKSEGCVPGIQLSHTGRKAGIRRPWDGYTVLDDEDRIVRNEPPWPVVGPSPIAYTETALVPSELSTAQMDSIIASWVAATRRAILAGYEVLEVHSAHGYLLHQFLSPISNHRGDSYGGDLTGRMRFPLAVIAAVRATWPREKPLLVRVSAVDGVEGGLSLNDTVIYAHELQALGVDAVDCSSGGIGGSATVSRLPRGPGFQVAFSARIRKDVGIPTVAVGLITTAEQAADVVDSGHADLVAIGREALIQPNWPSIARTQLQPDRGFAHWPPESGWWLDKRAASIASSQSAVR